MKGDWELERVGGGSKKIKKLCKTVWGGEEQKWGGKRTDGSKLNNQNGFSLSREWGGPTMQQSALDQSVEAPTNAHSYNS